MNKIFTEQVVDGIKLWVGLTIVIVITSWLLSRSWGVAAAITGLVLAVYHLYVAATSIGKQHKREIEEFVPFAVNIQPLWQIILTDHKFVDEAGWEKLMSQKTKTTSALKDEIRFSVLCPVGSSYLVYHPDGSYFANKVAYRKSIEELKPADSYSFDSRPWICVEEKPEGFAITLTPLDIDDEDITLAVIPYSIFMVLERFKYGKIKGVDAKAELTKHGWLEEENNPEDINMDMPFRLRHKYFELNWHFLD